MKILIDCFYYSFYIDKEELSKFKFPNNTSIEDIEKLSLINDKTKIKKVKTFNNLLEKNIKLSDNENKNVNNFNNKYYILTEKFKNLFKNYEENNCSNRLSNTKILEQLKYLYYLLTLIRCNL